MKIIHDVSSELLSKTERLCRIKVRTTVPLQMKQTQTKVDPVLSQDRLLVFTDLLTRVERVGGTFSGVRLEEVKVPGRSVGTV